MGKINIQMYSFTEGAEYDSKACLRKASEMGYDGVEFFGPNLTIPVEELKHLMEELHLEPVSLHAPAEQIESLIPFAEGMGMRFVGIGMEYMPDDASVHRFAETLNKIGKKCAEHGLTLTYHNHTQEFLPCGEKKVIDVLMDETNPDYVSFELDAGWCAAAGFDPVAFVKEYSGRVKLIHVKESSRAIGPQMPIDFGAIARDENGNPMFTEEQQKQMNMTKEINCKAGEGLVDWKALKEVADQHGCQAYIVERERSPEGSRLDCLKADIDYYRTQI